MLAIFVFMTAALALAVFLIVTNLRSSREEQRQLALARERAERARRDAERARAMRARRAAKIAEDQLLAAADDARGVADGLDRRPALAGRGRHGGRFCRDVSAPFVSR